MPPRIVRKPKEEINGVFLKLKDDATIFFCQNLKMVKYYFHLLCNSKQEDNSIISSVPYTTANTGIVRSLEKEGYLTVDMETKVICLGIGDLYVHDVHPLTAEIDFIKKKFESLKTGSSFARNKLSLSNALTSLLGYMDKQTAPTLNAGQLSCVFKYVYELMFGYPYREFLGKDIGQFKSLLNMYGGVQSVKLIVMYLSEDYVKNPSIGGLLHKKDVLTHRAVNGDTNKNITVNGKKSNGFI